MSWKLYWLLIAAITALSIVMTVVTGIDWRQVVLPLPILAIWAAAGSWLANRILDRHDGGSGGS